MANYNLTKIISKKYSTINENVSNEEKRVVDYYLEQDFDRILGKHIISQDDCDLVTTFRDGLAEIFIDCSYFDNIHIKIGNINNSNVICAYSNEKVIFSIVNKENTITNEVEYVNSNDVNVQETLGVSLENSSIGDKTHVDAIEFTYAKKENGNEVYEGSLSPILARAGSEEYFEFKSENSKNENAPSFIEKLIDGLNSNSIVSVSTYNDSHKLIDYINEIFKALQDKLEKTKAKKETKTKTKKRVLEKNKND